MMGRKERRSWTQASWQPEYQLRGTRDPGREGRIGGFLTILQIFVIRISEPSGDAEDISLLSPEEREKRRSFESKRKKHYNEFQAVKMARALMDEDDSEVLIYLSA